MKKGLIALLFPFVPVAMIKSHVNPILIIRALTSPRVLHIFPQDTVQSIRK